MPLRDFVSNFPSNLIMKGPRNLTAVLFFGGLSCLHYSVAIPSFIAGHWEGYLSLSFGIIFTAVSIFCWFARYELAILTDRELIRVRRGYRAASFEREIPFEEIRAVRLTSAGDNHPGESRIELLCGTEDIECPSSEVPSQQALVLAMALNVELIKIYPDEVSPEE